MLFLEVEVDGGWELKLGGCLCYLVRNLEVGGCKGMVSPFLLCLGGCIPPIYHNHYDGNKLCIFICDHRMAPAARAENAQLIAILMVMIYRRDVYP